jgi:hypothetical protein
VETGRPDEAIEAFERILKVDRAWPKLCEWLVRAHAQQARKDAGADREEMREEVPTEEPSTVSCDI